MISDSSQFGACVECGMPLSARRANPNGRPIAYCGDLCSARSRKKRHSERRAADKRAVPPESLFRITIGFCRSQQPLTDRDVLGNDAPSATPEQRREAWARFVPERRRRDLEADAALHGCTNVLAIVIDHEPVVSLMRATTRRPKTRTKSIKPRKKKNIAA